MLTRRRPCRSLLTGMGTGIRGHDPRPAPSACWWPDTAGPAVQQQPGCLQRQAGRPHFKSGAKQGQGVRLSGTTTSTGQIPGLNRARWTQPCAVDDSARWTAGLHYAGGSRRHPSARSSPNPVIAIESAARGPQGLLLAAAKHRQAGGTASRRCQSSWERTRTKSGPTIGRPPRPDPHHGVPGLVDLRVGTSRRLPD